eukprot:1187766-Prorocentrum_minimum.AAC.1
MAVRPSWSRTSGQTPESGCCALQTTNSRPSPESASQFRAPFPFAIGHLSNLRSLRERPRTSYRCTSQGSGGATGRIARVRCPQSSRPACSWPRVALPHEAHAWEAARGNDRSNDALRMCSRSSCSTGPSTCSNGRCSTGRSRCSTGRSRCSIWRSRGKTTGAVVLPLYKLEMCIVSGTPTIV